MISALGLSSSPGAPLSAAEDAATPVFMAWWFIIKKLCQLFPLNLIIMSSPEVGDFLLILRCNVNLSIERFLEIILTCLLLLKPHYW